MATSGHAIALTQDSTHGIAPTRDCTHTELHPAGLHPHGIAPSGIAPTNIWVQTHVGAIPQCLNRPYRVVALAYNSHAQLLGAAVVYKLSL